MLFILKTWKDAYINLHAYINQCHNVSISMPMMNDYLSQLECHSCCYSPEIYKLTLDVIATQNERVNGI